MIENTKNIDMMTLRQSLNQFNIMIEPIVRDIDNLIIGYNYDGKHFDQYTKHEILNSKKDLQTITTHLTNCMFLLDRMIWSKDIDCNKLLPLLSQILEILEKDNMMKYIDSEYKSMINMSEIVNMYRKYGKSHEDMINLLGRTNGLTNGILKNPDYNNSVYVSHLSVINSIIANIFSAVYQNDAVDRINSVFEKNYRSLLDFCKMNQFDMGTVLRLTINVETTGINIEFK
jgi:hypothetical protein